VLTAGLTREITRHTSFTLRGGPRTTSGRVVPELEVLIRTRLRETRLREADISLGYVRTQTTLFGLSGTADAQSVIAAAGGKLWGQLGVRVAPAVVRIARSDLQSRIYRFGFEVSRPIGKTLSFRTSYDFNVQRGDIYTTIGYPTIGTGAISRHVVWMGLASSGLARSDVSAPH
jgi:hypothetical protein